jgi:hypothetical protein
MSEPITNVPDAVAALGALPVPQGPAPQPDPIAEGRGLDLLALMDERAASKVSPVLAAVLDEAERLRAQVAALLAERHVTNEALDDAGQALRNRSTRIAELESLTAAATEYRVWEPGYGLYVRRSPGAAGFAILEARRTSHGRRAWTTSGLQYTVVLSDEELFCWPDAEAAVAEARRVLPGAVVGDAVAEESADKLTRLLAPTQVLREDDEFHLHHTYVLGRDLPELGGGDRG